MISSNEFEKSDVFLLFCLYKYIYIKREREIKEKRKIFIIKRRENFFYTPKERDIFN